jgi:hypothetical protein
MRIIHDVAGGQTTMQRVVHADTIGAREQARDFHNLQARRLWKSENLQHRCCSNYISGEKRIVRVPK